MVRVSASATSRRAGRPEAARLCPAIASRTGSRSEPTATGPAAASAARSAPIEQVRSCTPSPANRCARWRATGHGLACCSASSVNSQDAAAGPIRGRRPAAQPDGLDHRGRAIPQRSAHPGQIGQQRGIGQRQQHRRPRAHRCRPANSGTRRRRAKRRTPWPAQHPSVTGRRLRPARLEASPTGELRLARSLGQERAHADRLVVGGERRCKRGGLELQPAGQVDGPCRRRSPPWPARWPRSHRSPVDGPSRIATSYTSPAGTARDASPISTARAPFTGRPEKIISLARVIPMIRGSRWVPPAPGTTPRVISGRPSWASSATTRKSAASASSHPPPRA